MAEQPLIQEIALLAIVYRRLSPPSLGSSVL